MVAAKFVPELLPQVFLGPRRARRRRRSVRLNPRPVAPPRALVRRDEAAARGSPRAPASLERAVVVRPRRQRRRRSACSPAISAASASVRFLAGFRTGAPTSSRRRRRRRSDKCGSDRARGSASFVSCDFEQQRDARLPWPCGRTSGRSRETACARAAASACCRLPSSRRSQVANERARSTPIGSMPGWE